MRTDQPAAWQIHPFLRIAPPFLSGIFVGERQMPDAFVAWACAMASLALWLAWSMLRPVDRWTWKPLTGIAISLILFATGLSCSRLHRQLSDIQDSIDPAPGTGLVVQLQEVEGPDHGSYRTNAALLLPNQDRPEIHPAASLQLYIDTSACPFVPETGDLLAIHAVPVPIRNKGNPGEPDRASRSASKGIRQEAFLKHGDLMLLDRQPMSNWEGIFLRSRKWVEGQMHRYLPDEASADLASTLITGHRASMDQDLLRSYANTGVVHVIAISGLHLGMLHALLLWLLKPLFRRLGLAHGAGLFILPWLWAYACFTGASASVIRSAAMFTGIGIAMAMGRKQFFLNGLGSSALVLLAWRPDWIFNIGFQLSYAALLSIAMFQPGLRKLLHFKSPLARLVWDLITVTLAAQVLTAPLVAWHFHRLPLLFLFANLPVVPLSSMVLFLGILICLFSWLPWVAKPLGIITTLLIHTMNGQVLGIDAVPHASLTDLYPTSLQIMLSYAIIILLRYGSKQRKLLQGYLFWLLLTAFRILGMVEDGRIAGQRALVIFQYRRQSLYALVDGRDMLVLTDTIYDAGGPARERCITQAVGWFRCDPPVQMAVVPGTTLTWGASVRGWTIDLSGGAALFRERPGGTAVEVRNRHFDAASDPFRSTSGNRILVADGSCPVWKIQQWKSSSEGVPSRFHSVPEQGAFVFDMNPPPRPAP